jgi:hypothetical protein
MGEDGTAETEVDESVCFLPDQVRKSLCVAANPRPDHEARVELNRWWRGLLPRRSLRAGLRSVVAVAVAICGLVGPASASVSPDRLFSSALAAARAQRSVHYVSTAASRTVSVRMVGDAALDRGIQRIAYRKGGKTGHVTVLVVADTAYVRGDAFTLANFMGFSAAAASGHAGRWMRIPHTASGFATVAAGVRLKSTIDELTLRRPRVALPETVFDGQRVVGIRSTSTVSGHRRTDTVYVRAVAPRLPVAEVALEGSTRLSVTFSNWNEPVKVSAPTGAALTT